MATIRLEIVTPEARVYSSDVDSVVLPAVEGEIGVFPMHVPLMTQIKPGELVVRKGAEVHHLAVGEGFVEITQTRVNVLTDMAIESQQIDEAVADEAVRRAQQKLSEGNLGAEEVAAVEASMQKSLAQLRVKRRRTH